MSCNCCPPTKLLPPCRAYGSPCLQIVKTSFDDNGDFYRYNVFDTYWSVNLNFGGFLNGTYIPTFPGSTSVPTQPLGDFISAYGYKGYIVGDNSYDYLVSPTFCPTPSTGSYDLSILMGTVNASDMAAVCGWSGGGLNLCVPEYCWPFIPQSSLYGSFSATGTWATHWTRMNICEAPDIIPNNISHGTDFDCFTDSNYIHPYSVNCKDIFLNITSASFYIDSSGRRYLSIFGAVYGTYIMNARAPDSLTLYRVVQPELQRWYTLPDSAGSESIAKTLVDFNSLPDTVTINRV